jgi:hypothetical protein
MTVGGSVELAGSAAGAARDAWGTGSAGCVFGGVGGVGGTRAVTVCSVAGAVILTVAGS